MAILFVFIFTAYSIEVHHIQYQSFDWLKGFDLRTFHAKKYIYNFSIALMTLKTKFVIVRTNNNNKEKLRAIQ